MFNIQSLFKPNKEEHIQDLIPDTPWPYDLADKTPTSLELEFLIKVDGCRVRRLGGPPRANAGRLSLAGCKAGSAVGSAPSQL